MTPDQFTRLLRAEAKRLDLTVSDLAVWFARPVSTVRTWFEGERVPKAGGVLDECARRLKLLSTFDKMLVPYEVRMPKRRAFIKWTFDDADNAGVPARRPARNR